MHCPHSQDGAPPGTQATAVPFKAHLAFSKYLGRERRKKNDRARGNEGGKEEGKRETRTGPEGNFQYSKCLCLKSYNKRAIQIF